MTLAHNMQHVEQGLGKLIHRFRKPKIKALLGSWLSEVQALEDALWILYVETFLGVAEGDALDQLGRIVGQARAGRVDDVYRLWIRARILILRSSGRAEQLIAAARLVLTTITRVVWEEGLGPAQFLMHIEGAITGTEGNEFAKLLRIARAGGVRSELHWYTTPTPFRFAPGDSPVQPSPNGFDNGHFSAIGDGTQNYTW